MGELFKQSLQTEGGYTLKKSVIALWIAAALFLACSFTFLPDGIGEFVCGVAITAVLAFLGYK